METRRNFLAKTVGGMMAASLPFSVRAQNKTDSPREPFVAFNPYRGIDWKRCGQYASVSHIHVTDQETLDQAYSTMKIRHLPISNYYPSAPCYPASKTPADRYRHKQDFGVMHKGRFLDGPIDWSRLIMDEKAGWLDELPETAKKQLPFPESGPMITRIPRDLIISPNAEHHSFTNSRLHANGLGSLYASGHFDNQGVFLLAKHGYCRGIGLAWRTGFREILDQLLFPDAGGITINHPVWSGLSFEQVRQMLDFDPRVLGIEVYNDTCENSTKTPKRGRADKLWDELLSTGRKCLGFFTPDHTLDKGRNILLVPEFNERECLKAYRNGAFYGAIEHNGFQFTKIGLSGMKLSIALNRPGAVRLITNQGQAHKEESVTELEYKIPLEKDGHPKITFLRVEAFDQSGEKIYSQPFMFG